MPAAISLLSSHRRITFEYVMIKDFNDTLEDAARVLKLVRGIPSKINLIPFNEHPGADYKRPSDETVKAFQRYLMDRGLRRRCASRAGATFWPLAVSCAVFSEPREGPRNIRIIRRRRRLRKLGSLTAAAGQDSSEPVMRLPAGTAPVGGQAFFRVRGGGAHPLEVDLRRECSRNRSRAQRILRATT